VAGKWVFVLCHDLHMKQKKKKMAEGYADVGLWTGFKVIGYCVKNRVV